MRGAHGRESDAWWSIPSHRIIQESFAATIEPLPDTEGVATPGYCFTYSTVLESTVLHYLLRAYRGVFLFGETCS